MLKYWRAQVNVQVNIHVKNDPVRSHRPAWTGAVGAEFIATMDKRGFPRPQS